MTRQKTYQTHHHWIMKGREVLIIELEQYKVELEEIKSKIAEMGESL